MTWERLEPITEETRKPHACWTCEAAGVMPCEASMNSLIAVASGYAGVTKDGHEVLNERDRHDWCTFADAEALAAADPDHDWRVVLEAPLSQRTYQRQDGKWLLVEQGQGFA